MGLGRLLAQRQTKKKKHDIQLQELQNLEISDSLAMERTKLANERTLLAYMRTAMGMVLAGLTFVKIFADDPIYRAVGLIFLPLGVGVAIAGLRRFKKKKHAVAAHTNAYVPTSAARAGDKVPPKIQK